MVKSNVKTSAASKYIDIKGARMHYLEMGEGDPILFLHGVPTSSYVWRNIFPYLETLGRCIAPDLIGFGKSAKPDIAYSVKDHIEYIEGFIKALNLQKLIIVMHGLGSVIGLHYAMNHEKNCSGLVLYEAFLRPIDRDDLSLPMAEQLTLLNAEDNEQEIIRSGVSFVDKIFPQVVMQSLNEEIMAYYREPFAGKDTSRPIIEYFKELTQPSNKSQINKIIVGYSEKLAHSRLPKLLLYSIPGFITSIATIIWAKENLKNIEVNEIGEELHLAQESNPQLMGEIISVWLQGIYEHKI